MKITCNIIKDILPLYAEGMVSSDTIEMIEEHLVSCNNCREELSKLTSPIPIPSDINTVPLKKIQLMLQKRKTIVIILSVLFSLVIAISVIGYLTSPSYFIYSSDILNIVELENGAIVIEFNDKVSGYEISSYRSSDTEGYIYHINSWDSIWNRWFKKNNLQNIVLNPEGDIVDRVYYSQSNGEEDILVYARSIPNEGVITLPRLALNYYMVLAIILFVISLIAVVLTKKNKKIQNVMISLMSIPVVYIISSIVIRLFRPVTYMLAKDFFLIILLSIPIYSIFLLLYGRHKKQKQLI